LYPVMRVEFDIVPPVAAFNQHVAVPYDHATHASVAVQDA
jgi:hypothetical protein